MKELDDLLADDVRDPKLEAVLRALDTRLTALEGQAVRIPPYKLSPSPPEPSEEDVDWMVSFIWDSDSPRHTARNALRGLIYERGWTPRAAETPPEGKK